MELNLPIKKRNSKVVCYFDSNQVPPDVGTNFSKSPQKGKKLLEYWAEMGLSEHIDIKSFKPFEKRDFLIAHTPAYVNSFFNGVEPLCNSNGLKWSSEFSETLKWNNASLYNAILHATLYPSDVTFSPTAGFHHAQPTGGKGFCSFSGQVIASLKLWRQYGLRGAYIDLDGHHGNSIDDSYAYCPDLYEAIPLGNNINPDGKGEAYLNNLLESLFELYEQWMEGSLNYIVFCHGADSHIDDDIGGNQCNTTQWLKASEIVYNFAAKTGIPLTISLFGGYRTDDYQSVLNLHTGDMVKCLNILCGHEIEYKTVVKDNDWSIYDLMKAMGGMDNDSFRYTSPNYGGANKGYKPKIDKFDPEIVEFFLKNNWIRDNIRNWDVTHRVLERDPNAQLITITTTDNIYILKSDSIKVCKKQNGTMKTYTLNDVNYIRFYDIENEDSWEEICFMTEISINNEKQYFFKESNGFVSKLRHLHLPYQWLAEQVI